MTSNRIEELMNKTAYPESHSVLEAMYQVWNEMQQEFNSQVCKNCEYSEPHYDKELSLMCHKGVCNQILCEECGVTEDFGCNEFKMKKEK